MRQEQITTFDDQVVDLIQQYQQANNGKRIPHSILQEQFEGILLEDQKFKSAEYLATVLVNLKEFERIRSNDETEEIAYELVSKED